MTPRNIRLGLLLSTAWAVVLAAGFWGYGPALIALAAGALAACITLLWSSVQSLTGETPLSLEEALTLGAPSAEEEQKRSLLRALKDLEYERSVGKITPEDYLELSSRYRAEAIRLMKDLDQSLGPARERAEKLLSERLAREEETASEDDAEPQAEEPADELEVDAQTAEPPPSEPRAEAESSPEPDDEPSEAEEKPGRGLETVSSSEPEVKS